MCLVRTLISVTSHLCPKHLLNRWSVNSLHELLINPTSAPELKHYSNAELQVTISLFIHKSVLKVNSLLIFSDQLWNTLLKYLIKFGIRFLLGVLVFLCAHVCVSVYAYMSMAMCVCVCLCERVFVFGSSLDFLF